MKRAARCMLFVAWLLAGGSPALAEKRVALVVGNNDYEQVAALQKAVNDARVLGDTLEELGFRVLRATNVRRREMNLKLQEFASQLDPGDVALFFFAGHGVEIDGRNYLLPTDIPSAGPGQETFVKGEGIAVDRVLYTMRARGVRISTLILDACRDNPFARAGTRSLGGTRGLAGMAAPEGSFIMYSAGVGQTALDRLSDEDADPNSVFTRTLVPLLKQPGLSLVPMARRLRRDVQELARSISHEQRPAYYDEVTGEFFFAGKSGSATANTASKPAVPPSVPTADSKAIDLAYWSSIEDSTDIEDFRGYLRQFPTGVFADLAKRRAERLEQQQKTAALVPPETAATPAEQSKPSGQARGATLGVRIQTVTDEIAKSIGLETPKGALVASVTDGSPAQAAGLQDGDVILDFNGTKIETMRDLPRLVYFSAPGTEVGLTVLRQRSEKSLRAKLGKLDPDPILADEEKAAKGDAEAMLRTAERYEDGWFGKPDPAEVHRRLVSAAEAGSMNAMVVLGGREEEKGPGYLSNAYRWYREAAEKRHAPSALKVGLAYLNGNGVQKDASVAARFLRIAAGKGDADAMFNLGVLYQKGEGVTQDAAQAAWQYTGAVEKGHTGAMLNLAQLTDKGAGVKRDPTEAAKLMLKALMGGHEIASREMTTNASAWSAEFRRELQRLLKAEGAYQGALDGKFGSGTTAAVEALAGKNKQASSASSPSAFKAFFQDKAGADVLGLSLGQISDELRTRHGIAKTVEGALVVHVEPGSAADARKFASGDVIVEVMQRAVKTPEDVVTQIEAAKTSGRISVLLLVSDAKGNQRFVALPVK